MSNETCFDRVKSVAESQIEDIRLMLCPTLGDMELVDDGTLDTVVRLGDIEQRYSAEFVSDYRDESGLNCDEFFDAIKDDLFEEARERFYEHGLSFEYVQNDDGADYWLYLISTGGPGTEIRFYANCRSEYDVKLYRAEFWLLDWFDGAKVYVSGDETIKALWAEFSETGTAYHVMRKEIENEDM